MFNDKYGLTKAVLEGRKTMTRRIIHSDWLRVWGDKGEVNVNFDKEIGCFIAQVGPDDDDPMVLEPRFKPVEVVAVAQNYQEAGYYPMGTKDEPGWSNKMFVRADLMPHQIRITNVRVERLQDISDEDCFREGIVKALGLYGCEGLCERGDQLYFNTPRGAFAALIDRISGKGTWESNPWVFVYEFELVK